MASPLLMGASKKDILRRHANGLDPLDRALRKERLKVGELSDEKKEYTSNARKLLEEHRQAMLDSGLAFDHEFSGDRLGFKILIARYGEGRSFIQVDEVLPHCEIGAKLKPKDELVAINGELIVDPTEQAFSELKAKILKAPRPLRLTFIEGENHVDEHELEDKAFSFVEQAAACAKRANEMLEAARIASEAADKDACDRAAKAAEIEAVRACDIAVRTKALGVQDTQASKALIITADHATAAKGSAAAALRLSADANKKKPPPPATPTIDKDDPPVVDDPVEEMKEQYNPIITAAANPVPVSSSAVAATSTFKFLFLTATIGVVAVAAAYVAL